MADAAVLQLEQPLSAGAIRSVNFFNGRLLAGNDLSRLEDARRAADALLGRALGEGVAEGFPIALNRALSSPGLPVARIGAGVAVNRLGQVLRLAADTDIALARRFTAASGSALFGACAPLLGGTYVAGAGVYVLTVLPATAAEGRAASNGTDPANVRCNTDANVEAVQFRLLQVSAALLAGLPVGAASFQNALAYACFGPGALAAWAGDPFGAGPRDSEVPLGLLFFTGGATLQFIDLWSVRRPLARRGTGLGPHAFADHARLALGRAMYLQFQDQVTTLAVPGGGMGGLTVQAAFPMLPPAGIIPVAEETDDTDIQATAFFVGMTYHGPTFIDAAQVEGLIAESLLQPAIDTVSGAVVWLYRIRENRMAIDVATGAARPQSALVFASGELPYRGDARFDLSSFDYANFALGY
jgi:hypothetical protein